MQKISIKYEYYLSFSYRTKYTINSLIELISSISITRVLKSFSTYTSAGSYQTKLSINNLQWSKN